MFQPSPSAVPEEETLALLDTLESSLVGMAASCQMATLNSTAQLRVYLQQQTAALIGNCCALIQSFSESKGSANQHSKQIGICWSICESIEQGPLTDIQITKSNLQAKIPLMKDAIDELKSNAERSNAGEENDDENENENDSIEDEFDELNDEMSELSDASRLALLHCIALMECCLTAINCLAKGITEALDAKQLDQCFHSVKQASALFDELAAALYDADEDAAAVVTQFDRIVVETRELLQLAQLNSERAQKPLEARLVAAIKQKLDKCENEFREAISTKK
jgi:hypothetical protein